MVNLTVRIADALHYYLCNEYIFPRDSFCAALAALETSKRGDLRWAESEYDSMVRTDGVAGVRVGAFSGVIYVYTKVIYISANDRTYRMGRFRIELTPPSRNFEYGRIKIFHRFALSTIPTAHPGLTHPHVTIDGNCCFGNIGNWVYQLNRDNSYAVLAAVLIGFLRSYEYPGAFRNIKYWR